MATLTAANAVIMLAVSSLFDVPQQLQGFAADDVFTTEVTTPVETLMGVDGVLSGGWVATPKVQTISLQSDSLSNLIFEQWYNSQEQARETFIANANVTLMAVNQTYILLRGFLTGYPPMPDARRILQPRRYRITWGSIIGTPV
jgi:hypothetical protein